MPAAVERPRDDAPGLLGDAEWISRRLPGCRVEVIGGEITVTPLADMGHAVSLTDIMLPLLRAGLHGNETRVIQSVGVWLPDGPFDYAIPDLVVVDADYADHLVTHNCYDPAVFRMVLEATSSNYGNDLKKKVAAYAVARIPVYVIVDRRGQRVHVLTEPEHGEYRVHAVHRPGGVLRAARVRRGRGDAGGGRRPRDGRPEVSRVIPVRISGARVPFGVSVRRGRPSGGAA